MSSRCVITVVLVLLGAGLLSGCDGEGGAYKPDEKEVEAKPEPRKVLSFPQNTVRFVDFKEAMEKNPKLRVVENKLNAQDPITAPGKALKAMGSRIETLNLKHNIDIHHAQFDEYPSFEIVEGWIKSASAELKGLYPWQAYAYNEDDGEIVILQDQEYKIQSYKDAGLPEPVD